MIIINKFYKKIKILHDQRHWFSGRENIITLSGK